MTLEIDVKSVSDVALILIVANIYNIKQFVIIQ